MAIASRFELFPSAAVPVAPSPSCDWRAALPVLAGTNVVLRELHVSDASALLATFGSPEVARLISPPPPTLDGFERFVAWTQRQREAGQSFAFGITLRNSDTVIGIFQVRALQPGFDIAEWGFALGSEYWGSGLFGEAATLVLDYVFDVIGVQRLEARAALKNGRGNGALYKLGARQEGVLYRSFLRNGVYLDQVLWAILADERRAGADLPIGQLVH